MKKVIFATKTTTGKNYVKLTHDTATDIYYVDAALWGQETHKEYTHFNHAAFSFDKINNVLHNSFKNLVTTS